MKRLVVSGVLAAALLAIPDAADAARKRVVVKTTRGRVTVRTAPRVYLPAVRFTSVTVATLPSRDVRVWEESEELERSDGWTDFTMNVDERGSRLLLQIEEGSAQISSAEVVFESGEAQVVDFDDKVYRRGIYSLLDFKDGRKVDHIRIVARAASAEADVAVHLIR